jgi:hypothetical protein
MHVTDEFVNAAIEIDSSRTQSRFYTRGARLRERFPNLSVDDVREVFDVADAVEKLASQLAGQSLTGSPSDELAAMKRIFEVFPVVSQQTAQRAARNAFKFWGKL